MFVSQPGLAAPIRSNTMIRINSPALARCAGIAAQSSSNRFFELPPFHTHAIVPPMETLTEIALLIARHVAKDGFQATPIERLTLVRSSTVTMPMPNVFRPQLCLVAQGRKDVTFGDRVFDYAPGRYGIVTHDLPVTGQVVQATPDKPYLCLYLDFDPVILGQLALRVPPPSGTPSPPTGKTVSNADATLLDATLRLLRLLDDPAALPVLGPFAEQEILYRLLAGLMEQECATLLPVRVGWPRSAALSHGSDKTSGNGSASSDLPRKWA